MGQGGAGRICYGVQWSGRRKGSVGKPQTQILVVDWSFWVSSPFNYLCPRFGISMLLTDPTCRYAQQAEHPHAWGHMQSCNPQMPTRDLLVVGCGQLTEAVGCLAEVGLGLDVADLSSPLSCGQSTPPSLIHLDVAMSASFLLKLLASNHCLAQVALDGVGVSIPCSDSVDFGNINSIKLDSSGCGHGSLIVKLLEALPACGLCGLDGTDRH